jgi:hypothetical protein
VWRTFEHPWTKFNQINIHEIKLKMPFTICCTGNTRQSEKPDGAIKNGQSRETGNTSHMTKTKKNTTSVFSTIFMATTKLSIIPKNQSSSYIYVICVCLLIEVPNIYWLCEWHGGYLLESWDCLSFMDAWVHPRLILRVGFVHFSFFLCKV